MKSKNNDKFSISNQLINFTNINAVMNKYFFSLIIVFTLLNSCQTNNSNTLRIKGEIDIDSQTSIYLIVADLNNQPVTLDTIVSNNGSFELETEIIEPNFYFLQIAGDNNTFPFIAERGTVNISLFKDSLGLSKAKGTTSNDDFMRYKSETKKYIESLNGIGNDLQQAMILKDSLLAQDLQEQYKEVREQIQEYELDFLKASPNSLLSILILERFISSKVIPIDEAKNLFDSLEERIKNTRSGKSVKNQLEQSVDSVEVGQIAPRFDGNSPSGKPFVFENSLAKVTIIDFWASWCRPCRIENPNLVQLYHRNKDRGLNIVGVSLDKERNKWLKAIEDDGLVWDHVSNLMFWNDPIAKLYKVSAIPATFVLDQNGVIVARNLRGAALYKKIEELLSNI
ncbi:thioredoxin [Bacteroidetes bacterium SCGC AAA795-G10]|nr:thioredoxin [Bacteroidetes bacterium SCGC AAA795-G10]